MAREFDIKINGQLVKGEPTPGKWYVAAELRDGIEICGALGEYSSDGEFYDDDSDVDLGPDMRCADYIIEQA